MARTALDRAERLFASGRFAELVTLLEPQVPIYRESPRFYYLLGAACLRSGDLVGASTYLKRAEQLLPGSRDAMLAMAAVHVRRGETERAVDYYLRVLEDSPRDAKALACLELLRKDGGPDGLARLVETGAIERLYPGASPLRRLALPLGLGLGLGLAAALVLALAWPLLGSLAASIGKPRTARPEVAAITLSKAETAAPVQSSGSFRYVLTEKQALDAFEAAKDYFQRYRDDAALVEINRLLGSNASPAIKEKAKSLRAFVGKPDFRTVRDAPSYAQAISDPALYDGCSVAWKGMAANVRSDSAGVAFDFLVGYQDKKVLEGIVAARISGAEVPVDRPLEILGILRAQAAGAAGLSMDCAAIHELPSSAPSSAPKTELQGAPTGSGS